MLKKAKIAASLAIPALALLIPSAALAGVSVDIVPTQLTGTKLEPLGVLQKVIQIILLIAFILSFIFSSLNIGLSGWGAGISSFLKAGDKLFASYTSLTIFTTCSYLVAVHNLPELFLLGLRMA